MDLILFCVFLSLSFLLVALGFYREEHMELPLVGFFFLFLLALSLIGGNVEQQIGEQTNTTYTYSGGNLTFTQEDNVKIYAPLNLTTTQTQQFGYYFAVATAIGFIGVILSMRRVKF